ncbi:mitogen-activated protein kinase kinase kinase 14 [Austrofundulus limnaeus]|uniref:Mitogen-activated protein kinase kinase kinase 14 n=1 Tax=Austrofundulus limnaeus TaxID=52670 RepID=A0A2I4BRD2_AUSLI|nr:PREDICTED: mitogen-activated protein kinase kinase kinase 14 [Austrofundulus limnaeus]
MFGSNTRFCSGGYNISPRPEEGTDQLVQTIGPNLTRVMSVGTAKQVLMDGLEDESCLSVVAQAESEDFQEFSPSNIQSPYSRSEPGHRHRVEDAALLRVSDDEEDEDQVLHRNHRRPRRKTRSCLWRPGEGPEAPVIQGLWVQEIDWLKTTSSSDIIPPPPQFTDSCCHGNRLHMMSSDPADGSGDSQEPRSDSSCCIHPNVSDLTLDLMHVSGFNSAPHTEEDSDSEQSILGVSDSFDSLSSESHGTCGSDDTSDPVFEELRGRVTQIPKLFASALFRDPVQQILDVWKTSGPANEGLVFHQLLQPSNQQYREGEEYYVLDHIQNGSYGDVFCVQDRRTGFRCAAKKVPLGLFRSEEVRTWSSLSSPRVVDLFGAVRDGLNVVLFMDLKPACLSQLLKEMTCLPEDLALHYLHQTLGALEHLHHRKVVHLDVKVDNVLLSADCRDTFLCDFGLSQRLDEGGRSSKAFRGAVLPGTESHMAPEVARGDPVCAEADVWSSCCMLLHMLNGFQPWVRFFSQPLCLHIANEPPPLWEVPSTCNNFTAKVFSLGLQKDPNLRASAEELRRKTTKAFRAVGGLSPVSIRTACQVLDRGSDPTPSSSSSSSSSTPDVVWVSPWRTLAVKEDDEDCDGDASDLDSEADGEWDSHPRSLREDYIDEADWDTSSGSDVDIYMGEEEQNWVKSLKTDDYEGDWEEEEEDSLGSTEYLRALRGVFPVLQKGLQMDQASWGSDAELENLRDDVPEGTTLQTPTPEPRDDPPSCFSCSDSSQMDQSETDSDHSSDDLSSGVFSSCNSQSGAHLEWTVSANQTPSHCLEGVDVWIENVQGACLRIRERRWVKVGHVAIGISDQMSGKSFTLETLDRKTVSFEEQIQGSGLWFLCVPAPDRCQRWRWRVRDGQLELRE